MPHAPDATNWSRDLTSVTGRLWGRAYGGGILGMGLAHWEFGRAYGAFGESRGAGGDWEMVIANRSLHNANCKLGDEDGSCARSLGAAARGWLSWERAWWRVGLPPERMWLRGWGRWPAVGDGFGEWITVARSHGLQSRSTLNCASTRARHPPADQLASAGDFHIDTMNTAVSHALDFQRNDDGLARPN